MFSVTYTGMNFFPLCTAMVCPTISGTTVDRRDQVLMTFFSLARFSISTFSSRWRSMNGPFFSERPIGDFPSTSKLELQTSNLLLPSFHHEPVRGLVPARLVSLRRHAPRRHRVAAARCLAFAATQRMVDGIHGDAAHVRPPAEPAASARFADRDV